ncbi:SmpA / OmlA family protein [Aquimixticola soesokkakensis]|uniref:SmpA / OmlA family protein n=1 Tax=Aquimixticola soesokkakensis TaxID=1519096 RepID=A0A1Y5TM14_9RHOB|nr:outer membrane protein assembly factor BamE [Aquimixticola soesokkakensis]SLN65074.1 SmpA / OmlA family protein [Aquimixticola soesokkakensis]
MGQNESATGIRRAAARLSQLVLGAVVCVALVACTPIVKRHGYIPPEEDLAQISVGVDSQQSVADKVGRPAAMGLIEGAGWYYVGSTFQSIGPFAPRETRREVLAISFDAAGLVSNVERFGLEDGNVIVLSRRVTDPNVGGTTFVRQLLGNLGRISADQFIQ